MRDGDINLLVSFNWLSYLCPFPFDIDKVHIYENLAITGEWRGECQDNEKWILVNLCMKPVLVIFKRFLTFKNIELENCTLDRIPNA